MGELTAANAKRIDWKLAANRSKRRIGELIFFCVLFSFMSFCLGYFAGKKGLTNTPVPDYAIKFSHVGRDEDGQRQKSDSKESRPPSTKRRN